MNNITFQNENIQVDPRDLMNFFQALWSNQKYHKSKSITVNSGIVEDIADKPSMVNVYIKFQVWNKGELGSGTRYTFKSFRHRGFACSGSSIYLTPSSQTENV